MSEDENDWEVNEIKYLYMDNKYIVTSCELTTDREKYMITLDFINKNIYFKIKEPSGKYKTPIWMRYNKKSLEIPLEKINEKLIEYDFPKIKKVTLKEDDCPLYNIGNFTLLDYNIDKHQLSELNIHTITHNVLENINSLL